MEKFKEELAGAVARGWCHKKNECKIMDEDLAWAIVDEVMKLLAPKQVTTNNTGSADPGPKNNHTRKLPLYTLIKDEVAAGCRPNDPDEYKRWWMAGAAYACQIISKRQLRTAR